MNSTSAGEPWWGICPPFPDYQENSFPDYPYVGDPISDPNRVGDFPLKKLHELFRCPSRVTKSTDGSWQWSLPLSNKTVWFNQIDGGQKFVLELAGYSKEEIGVKIDGEFLKVTKKKPQNIVNPETHYKIPSAEILDLTNTSVRMENGLLEISFPKLKKKDAPKTIVLL